MDSPVIPSGVIPKRKLRKIIIDCLIAGRKKQAAKLLWPWIVKNEWRDKIYDHLDANPYAAIMGHGSAAKTFTTCEYFLMDWWADPQNTALVITSDTLGSMDRRIWSDIKRLWSQTSVTMPGILVDSKRLILYSQFDKKNAIAGMAAEDKDSETKIQGLHTKRIRVIIDEADNKDSQSVWKALSNLATSGELKVAALANPSNRMSEFGRHTEPINGWSSVNAEADFSWVSKMGWGVLRLDGLRSPNLKAGHDVFPFLLTNKAVQDIRTKKGELDPEWWSYIRGMYSPQGDRRTIFSPDILTNCRKPITWYSSTTPIAACDPALEDGGDCCVLGIGIMGKIGQDPKKTGVKPEKFLRINRKNLSTPASMDKGDQIIELLKAHGVQPQHFIIDCTGEGRGISDYIKFAWNQGKAAPTVDVRFGGGATEMTLTTESTKKANELYDRFVSELWFAAREWCKLGLVWIPEGMPRELTVDLESRLYELWGAKDMISIETKKAMKGPGRNLPSPDFGDTFCLLIHLTRLLASGFTPGLFAAQKKPSLDRFKKFAYVGNANYGIKS